MCVTALYRGHDPLIFQVAFVTFFAVPEPQPLPLPSLVPPPPDEQPVANVDKFDVHTWFAAHLAEARDDDAAELAGVPFH